jgi:hypothetical protein
MLDARRYRLRLRARRNRRGVSKIQNVRRFVGSPPRPALTHVHYPVSHSQSEVVHSAGPFSGVERAGVDIDQHGGPSARAAL